MLIGSGTAEVVAGQTALFRWSPVDTFGNLILGPMAAPPRLVVSSRDTSPSVTVSRDGINGGGISVTYTATVSGVYTLFAVAPGTALHAYAWNVTVRAGVPSVATTELSGSGVSQVGAGREATFSVVVRDAFFNPVTETGYRFVSVLSSPSGSRILAPNCSADTYVCWYNTTVAGLFALSVMRGLSPISGSPYAVQVLPAAFSPSKSTTVGASMGTAGIVNTFSVGLHAPVCCIAWRDDSVCVRCTCTGWASVFATLCVNVP